MIQVKGCARVELFIGSSDGTIIDLFYTRDYIAARKINLARAGYRGGYA